MLHTMRPPWASDAPVPAPGGIKSRHGAAVLKHCLLYFSKAAVLALGSDVRDALLRVVPWDRTYAGAVALPNYYCTERRPVRVRGEMLMLPCGNTVPLSPLLQCVIDGKPTKHWRCDACAAQAQAPAPGSAQSPAPGGDGARCLKLFPRLEAKGRQGNRQRTTLLFKTILDIELIVSFEPDDWQSMPEDDNQWALSPGPMTPRRWEAKWQRRFLYTPAESARVWRLAQRLPSSAW